MKKRQLMKSWRSAVVESYFMQDFNEYALLFAPCILVMDIQMESLNIRLNMAVSS